MRLPLAIATLFLTATTALPAFAAAPAPIALRDAAATPIEAVQYQQQQQQTTRQRRQSRNYRSGYRGYASAPRARSGYNNPRGNCVGGLSRGAESAFPSWDTCSGR